MVLFSCSENRGEIPRMLHTSVRTRFILLLIALPAALSAQSSPSSADRDQLMELRSEIKSLQQGQEKIGKDLSAIMDILTGKKPPLEDVFVTVAGSPSVGAS